MSQVLVINSVTDKLSVALFENNLLREIETTGVSQNHSEYLLVNVDRVLQNAGSCFRNLDQIYVSSGPYSFTGIRIGIAFVDGVMFAENTLRQEGNQNLLSAGGYIYSYIFARNLLNNELIDELGNKQNRINKIIENYKINDLKKSSETNLEFEIVVIMDAKKNEYFTSAHTAEYIKGLVTSDKIDSTQFRVNPLPNYTKVLKHDELIELILRSDSESKHRIYVADENSYLRITTAKATDLSNIFRAIDDLSGFNLLDFEYFEYDLKSPITPIYMRKSQAEEALEQRI